MVWLLAMLSCGSASAQTVYAGTLGGEPIELVLYAYSDGVVIATYAYAKYDTPIRIDGKLSNGVLALEEKDAAQAVVATLRFAPFAADAQELRGSWLAASGTKSLPILLGRQYDMGPVDGPDDPELELLQAASTRDHYFRLVTGGTGHGPGSRATAVNVYRKRTDELLQRIDLDTQFRGIDSVQVGDFDFDGVADLSVFESSYAGPNTSSLYFLWDAASGRYEPAAFEGVSLQFDPERKLVYEHNQCCAGASHENATYRVVGRKLELVEKKCLRMDEDSEDLVEVPCSE